MQQGTYAPAAVRKVQGEVDVLASVAQNLADGDKAAANM
jgi:hypothetical protein